MSVCAYPAFLWLGMVGMSLAKRFLADDGLLYWPTSMHRHLVCGSASLQFTDVNESQGHAITHVIVSFPRDVLPESAQWKITQYLVCLKQKRVICSQLLLSYDVNKS